jgi:hypothetical protein
MQPAVSDGQRRQVRDTHACMHGRMHAPTHTRAHTRTRTHAHTPCPPHQDPNPEDPLNKDAAAKLQENARSFESYVQRSINYGLQIDGAWFPPCAG